MGGTRLGAWGGTSEGWLKTATVFSHLPASCNDKKNGHPREMAYRISAESRLFDFTKFRPSIILEAIGPPDVFLFILCYFYVSIILKEIGSPDVL